ncbi:unnamed protein product [Phaedon cochleariae]|uniref:Uncharacterized protein n=1 Tax=Phaedon cochleariae TaxID=80249 RepID=A0A9N9SI98_PHACE|nr:unnamed protein product [Phaedon cochleariae]
MEDEMLGENITDFVGLRSQQYTFLVNSNKPNTEGGKKCIEKSKGVKFYVVKKKITFDDYLDCLKNNKEKYEKQRNIQSHPHEVYSIEQTKIVLSTFDDKRYLIDDSTDTSPYGHYSILKVG